MRAKDYQDKIDKLQRQLTESHKKIQDLQDIIDLQQKELNDLNNKYTTICIARADKNRLIKRQLEIFRQEKVITELNKKLHAGGRAALSQEEQEKIRELRLTHHYSIRKIAKELHHSTRTIQKYTVAVDDEHAKESNKEKERNELRKSICPLLLAHIATGGLPPINKFSCPVQENWGIYSFFDIPSHDEPHE